MMMSEMSSRLSAPWNERQTPRILVAAAESNLTQAVENQTEGGDAQQLSRDSESFKAKNATHA